MTKSKVAAMRCVAMQCDVMRCHAIVPCHVLHYFTLLSSQLWPLHYNAMMTNSVKFVMPGVNAHHKREHCTLWRHKGVVR